MAEPYSTRAQAGVVVKNEQLSRATRLLRVEAEESVNYSPGHILGLEITSPGGEALKGPYTVTRSSSPKTFEVLYRVIPDGRKTPFMELMGEGDVLRFGGRFGTPVAEGVASGAERVVGVATGVGIGPLLGYAEQALSDPSGPAVELYVGFREQEDVCCADECEALSRAHPDRFCWAPCLSAPAAAATGGELGPGVLGGRVTAAVPALLGSKRSTHFHLVGNGQFVNEWKSALLTSGVAEECLTTETYFNGKALPGEGVVERLVSDLRGLSEDDGEPEPDADVEDEASPALVSPPSRKLEQLTSSQRDRLAPAHELVRKRVNPKLR